MADELDWSHIARYVSGACSDEERRVMTARLAVDAALRDTVEAAQRIWTSTAPASDEWNVPAAWSELVRKEAATRSLTIVREHGPERHAAPAPLTDAAGRRATGRGRGGVRRRAVAWTWAAAAAATVAIGVGLRWQAGSAGRATALDSTAPMYTVATRPGQRLDLRMPDGTRVVLGVASTLRYPKTYGTTTRELYLDGEAYFDVVHDAARPFVVHSRDAVARDLGTRFDVRAYPEDGGVEVAVAEGKVELARRADGPAAAAAPVVLTPGQLGRVGAAGAVTRQTAADLSRRFAWIDGRLEFVDVPLRDVLPQLSRWYDVEFRLVDRTLGARPLTATFENESLPELLRFLGLSLNARYELEGRTVTLIPSHRTP